MKEKNLKVIAKQILETIGEDNLELIRDINGGHTYYMIRQRGEPDFSSGICVNVCYAQDGKLMIVNYEKGNASYEKINSSIKRFIQSNQLEVLSQKRYSDDTTYLLDGDLESLALEPYEIPSGQHTIEHLDFLEAECLMRGLPIGTTSHELGCMKYLVDPRKTSEEDLDYIKCGLDPKKASEVELFCAQYGLDPKTVNVEEVSWYSQNVPPLFQELSKIFNRKGEITPDDKIMADRQHFYNCDITDKQVEKVNYLFWEFPDNYPGIIPLTFRLEQALKEEDYEYAAKLRDKINQITAMDSFGEAR